VVAVQVDMIRHQHMVQDMLVVQVVAEAQDLAHILEWGD
jgi:hypothetical protein